MCDILWADPLEDFGSEKTKENFIHNHIRWVLFICLVHVRAVSRGGEGDRRLTNTLLVGRLGTDGEQRLFVLLYVSVNCLPSLHLIIEGVRLTLLAQGTMLPVSFSSGTTSWPLSGRTRLKTLGT
jgi:hypothetical protein